MAKSATSIGMAMKANGNRHLNSGSESLIPKFSQYCQGRQCM